MATIDRDVVALNMRVDAKKRNLIDAAVQVLGTDRTSFVVEAALAKAYEILLEQRLFVLDDDAFAQFEQALGANSLGDNECLRQLLDRPKRWV